VYVCVCVCVCVTVKRTNIFTRVNVVFCYVKHVPISCVLLIYGYVILGASHGGRCEANQDLDTHRLCAEWEEMSEPVSVYTLTSYET
jgi:hypothetical protein